MEASARAACVSLAQVFAQRQQTLPVGAGEGLDQLVFSGGHKCFPCVACARNGESTSATTKPHGVQR
jgi:hypothetical protein